MDRSGALQIRPTALHRKRNATQRHAVAAEPQEEPKVLEEAEEEAKAID